VRVRSAPAVLDASVPQLPVDLRETACISWVRDVLLQKGDAADCAKLRVSSRDCVYIKILSIQNANRAVIHPGLLFLQVGFWVSGLSTAMPPQGTVSCPSL
jgi:hypothetical protein